jgi:hypothetical protein
MVRGRRWGEAARDFRIDSRLPDWVVRDVRPQPRGNEAASFTRHHPTFASAHVYASHSFTRSPSAMHMLAGTHDRALHARASQCPLFVNASLLSVYARLTAPLHTCGI